ncbi:MAG: Asp-tRNA(Asn)/Glu-tRNA(Gln) amidotransferase subunit GatC [Planctomycetota bacterium]
MSITRDEVAKVSLLARLRLTDAELDTLTTQLSSVLDYMELLSEVDTSEVEPMAHAVEVSNVLRGDEVQPSLPRDAALANAPSRDDECYLVPAVLGDG